MSERRQSEASPTRRAVVSYAVGATREERIAAYRDGIQECAFELADLTSPQHAIDALEEAISGVEWDAE